MRLSDRRIKPHYLTESVKQCETSGFGRQADRRMNPHFFEKSCF